MKLLQQKEFFRKYNISMPAYRKAKINWKTLETIFQDYLTIRDGLKDVAQFIANKIAQSAQVHSTRFRVKNPEHLVEKIIRKQIERHERNISIKNYRNEITDLVGVRALHLFKDDWVHIHKTITNCWKLKEVPKAFVREGDADEIIKMYENEGCEVKKHPYGYRSVHYIVKSAFTKELESFTEIQVRTVFEEGWSEVDHRLRYPYDFTNPVLTKYLSILNNLCGNADDMASFIQRFFADWSSMKDKNDEYKKKIDDLEKKIKELKIDKKKKEELIKELRSVENSVTSQNISFGAGQKQIFSGFEKWPSLCLKCGKINDSLTFDGLCAECRNQEAFGNVVFQFGSSKKRK